MHAENVAAPLHVPAAEFASVVQHVEMHEEIAAAALLLSGEPVAAAAAWWGSCHAVVTGVWTEFAGC